VRTVAALVLSGMLFAAGTPISWVAVVTAILMFLIWTEIWSSRSTERDDVI
jgi:cell division protein FtsW (lipid II flippase)